MASPAPSKVIPQCCAPPQLSPLQVMQKMERWIVEHRQDSRQSRLRRMVPSVGSFFTPLRLVEAFREYDEHFALSRRRYVPPNFAEMRHVLNIAQVMISGRFVRPRALMDASGLAVCMRTSAKMQHVINVAREASARKLCATAWAPPLVTCGTC